MNQNYLLLSLCFITILLIGNHDVSSQTEKGRWFIAAGIPLRYQQKNLSVKSDFITRDNIQKDRNLSFAPNFGYFAIDNLLVGLAIPVSNRKIESQDEFTDSDTESWQVLLDPYLQYYFANSSKIKPYIKGELAVGTLWTETTGFNINTIKTKSSVFGYGAGAGIAYWFNSTIGLHLELIYERNTIEDKDDDLKLIEKGIDTRLGFSISL